MVLDAGEGVRQGSVSKLLEATLQQRELEEVDKKGQNNHGVLTNPNKEKEGRREREKKEVAGKESPENRTTIEVKKEDEKQKKKSKEESNTLVENTNKETNDNGGIGRK
ncbi:hypothetical protein AAHE18_14G081700 [Arachis hypogaea]